jgi:branched-subunit amino acid transport protein AzlD
MCCLFVNAIGSPVKADIQQAVPMFVSAAVTLALHLWKRNTLVSIIGGTALYMVLLRLVF